MSEPDAPGDAEAMDEVARSASRCVAELAAARRWPHIVELFDPILDELARAARRAKQ